MLFNLKGELELLYAAAAAAVTHCVVYVPFQAMP
jgi:hypothetical protein